MRFFRGEHLDSSLTTRFILPVIWENLLVVLIGLLFSRLVSGISASALAAIGMANNLMGLLFSMFALVTTGSAVLIARHIGAREPREAGQVVEQTILLTLLTSLGLTALCYGAATPLLRLLMPTAEAQLFRETVRYFRILVLSLPAYTLQTVLSTVCRVTDDSRSPFLVALLMNLVLLGSGYVLIRLCHLEEIGAGLSYIICRTVGTALIFYALCRNRTHFVLQLKNVFRPVPAILRRIVRIGVPVSIESTLLQAGYLLANVMIIALGSFEAGVYQVMNTLHSFMAIPQPICNAVSLSAAGHLLGAGRPQDARKSGRLVWAWGVAISTVLCLGVIVFAAPLSALYSGNAATVQACARHMWILLFMTVAGVSINAIDPQLRSGGDVRRVMGTTLAGVWLLRLPLTWLFCFPMDMGVLGVYLANTIALTFRAVVGLIRHSGTKWYRKKI